MVPMLEKIHLKIVKAVNEKGSLTAAADALCLTQSALSHTIKKLEQKIGAAIWLREGRSLRLTQAGNYVLSLANRVLPQLDHAEAQLCQWAKGQRGTLRIGMECHPCYQWLLKVVSPFLTAWPDVDVDVKQKFQFGGVGALFFHEIDMLVTPDPFIKPGLIYEPVFDYEQVLVVSKSHPLAKKSVVQPDDLREEILLTYPVEKERLDIFRLFLNAENVVPRSHKRIETTDILLQMVASGRGVTALPRWLANEYRRQLGLACLSLGREGVSKQLYLGFRRSDAALDYMQAFIDLSKSSHR